MTDLQLGQEGVGGFSRTLPNGLTVNFRIGHLDKMPRCKACGRVLCSHPDPVFQGLIPSTERR